MEWVTSIIGIFNPNIFIYLAIGVLAGAIIGALPGLSCTMGVAILTPLTFWLAPEQGFAMLIGVYNSSIWAGGISAILINTPGTPASIATTFDGYAMTKRGEGGLALGINTIYSVIGGLFSTIVLIFASFPLARFALKFGPPEYFAIAIFGIAMMISVSGENVLKGIIVGVAGLLLSTIGVDPMLAQQRFTLGNPNLIDGISFIPIMIGLFGIGEVLFQVFNNDRVKRVVEDVKLGRVLVNAKEFIRLLPSTIMSCIVSVIVGAIPGTGGDISSIICWGQAKRMSKKPEEFGKGSIEGCAASCTSNNGVIGGALTTMLTLGIPGDAVTAVLIGSLMMYGMQPGPRMFIENRPFVITLMSLMIVANLVVLVLGLATSKVSAGILKVRQETVWVAVTILCIIGAYALNNSFYEVVYMAAAGILGFIFKKMNIPAGPFILGLLLGRLVESNLRRSLALSNGDYSIFYTRPLTTILLLLVVISLVSPTIKKMWKKNKAIAQ